MLNTLDLDKVDKEQLNRIIQKLQNCPFSATEPQIKIKDSSAKGYHVFIECSEICNNCRYVFDDPKRLEIDLQQSLSMQNTFFDSKEWFIWRDVFGKTENC